MKVSLVLCLVFAVVGLNADTVHLTGEQKDKATKAAMECITETGVKPELVAEAKKGQFSENQDFKKFTLCFFQKSGIVGSDGKLNVEVALSKVPAGVDKADVAKVLEDCKGKQGKDAAETAFEIFKCYQAGSKTTILL